MRRIIPTAVVAFGVVMLMLRAFEIEGDAARAAANNSSRIQAVDGVLQSVTQATGFALPPGLLVAGIAMIFAVGYAVVG
jgi:hypothetical protein